MTQPIRAALVGYDNTTLAASAPINLTSVDQAAHDLGATAARSSVSGWTAAAAPFSPRPRPS